MGDQEKKTQTELGIKCIYQYLILTIIINLVITIYAALLFIQGINLVDFSSSNISLLFILIFIILFTIIWLIRGLIYFFNGRVEFDDEHESNVIFASILIIVYITILLINLVYSKGFTGGIALINALSTGFSSSNTIPFIVNIALSTVTFVIFGLALVYIIYQLVHPVKKNKLWILLYFLIAGTFTFNLTYFIGLIFIFKTYKETYYRIHKGWIKIAKTAPCPKCRREIPFDSSSCPYCSIQFKYDPSLEIDSRFIVNTPKLMYVAPKGYTPTQGLSEKEKRRFKTLIAGVVAVILVVAVIIIVL